MDTLYCFKLCEDTGEIQRYVISEYKTEHHMWNSNKDAYCFTANFGTQADYPYKVRKDKMNQMYHNKVFTFIDDFDFAADIMINTLRCDRDSCWHKYTKLANTIKSVQMFLRGKTNGT